MIYCMKGGFSGVIVYVYVVNEDFVSVKNIRFVGIVIFRKSVNVVCWGMFVVKSIFLIFLN